MRRVLRPIGRQRKLLKFCASGALLIIIYVTTTKRPRDKLSVKCLNGVCSNNDDAYREAQRNFDAAREDTSLTWDNSTVVVRPLNPDIVVYNRVPKCASSTFRHLISRLKMRNRFKYEIHNWPNVKQSLSAKEEEDLVQQVTSLPRPLLFLRHLHFVDFQKHNASKPAYINVIRDPVDRFVSHYYFSRYGFVNWTEEKIKNWLWPMPDEQREMDLDECVRLGAEKCVRDNRENMLEFFCGQDKRCGQHDDWALERAKENIANNYVFIGILEQFEDSLKVVEAILPRFFSGVRELHRDLPESGARTKTARKKEPSHEAREGLKRALRREINLYNFVKKRFEIQLNALRESGKIT